MFDDAIRLAGTLVGAHADDPTLWQLAARAFLVYVLAILLVKLGERRFMGRGAAFDVILGIMLGSVLSRSITHNGSVYGIVAVGIFLTTLHWLFAVASYHWERFGQMVKGRDRELVVDGQIQWKNMRRSHVSRGDLEMALRMQGRTTDTSDVRIAKFERSGDISVITRASERQPKIVEVLVREGVQTVRIEMC